MDHHNLNKETMSESIEMYLLRIVLLQKEGLPVPIPTLAEELSISSVSANEMCRKLMNKGLVDYEPYKGVTLTTEGTALAERVLRCRRLWEVFFVEKLGVEPEIAEEMACRFEHVTPEDLAGRLATFLENPLLSPQNEPIPYGHSTPIERPVWSLTTLTTGELGRVVNVVADQATKDFLRQQGLSPGIVVAVLAVGADGTVLLNISGQHLSLSPIIAAGIDITSVAEEDRQITGV
jgi:DtxR family Mn-dependent transcriptional regulator